MGQKNQVLVNGRSVVTKASGGKAMACPDVCKTPAPVGPPLPIPYPNVAESKNINGACRSVKIDGAAVLTQNAKLKSSAGDEPGSLGGLASGTSRGAAKSLSHSSDCKIAGQGIVRNLDAMQQNDGNAVGSMLQPQGPPPKAQLAQKDEPEQPPDCEVCGKGHATPSTTRIGNNNAKQRPSIAHRLRNHYGPQDEWKAHPGYVGPGAKWQKCFAPEKKENGRFPRGYATIARSSLQGHHLIVCEILKSPGKSRKKNKPTLTCASTSASAAQPVSSDPWGVFCRVFGYDVDHPKNGVLLPAVHQVACKLVMPCHDGNHNLGYIYDQQGQRILSKKEPQTDKVKKRKRRMAEELAFYVYPEAVRAELDPFLKEVKEGNFCQNPEQFVCRLNKISARILKKLQSFRWTLRADGLSLQAKKRGCLRTSPPEFGFCRQQSGQIDRTTHEEVRSASNFKLKVGR